MKSGLKFGLLYEFQFPKPWHERSEYEGYQQVIQQTVLAEEMGFEYVWLVEHHFLTEFAHSSAPEVFLAALSQRTTTMRLGHGVVLLTTNHPARVAERIATLDVLSNGRVEFGTGRGGGAYQIEPFGTPLADTKAKWEEALSIIPRMMTEEVFSHKGKYFDIEPREIWPKPLQKPHPPLWVACVQPASFEDAGRKGIGALAFTQAEPGILASRVQLYRDAIKNAEPVGLAVNNQVSAYTLGICLETDKRAMEVARPAALWHADNARRLRDHDWKQPRDIPESYKYHFERYQGNIPDGRLSAGGDLEQLVSSGTYCIGNPDTTIRTIEKYQAAGVDQIMLLMQFGGVPHDKIMESIRLYGKHVIPHFQKKDARAPLEVG